MELHVALPLICVPLVISLAIAFLKYRRDHLSDNKTHKADYVFTTEHWRISSERMRKFQVSFELNTRISILRDVEYERWMYVNETDSGTNLPSSMGRTE